MFLLERSGSCMFHPRARAIVRTGRGTFTARGRSVLLLPPLFVIFRQEREFSFFSPFSPTMPRQTVPISFDHVAHASRARLIAPAFERLLGCFVALCIWVARKAIEKYFSSLPPLFFLEKSFILVHRYTICRISLTVLLPPFLPVPSFPSAGAFPAFPLPCLNAPPTFIPPLPTVLFLPPPPSYPVPSSSTTCTPHSLSRSTSRQSSRTTLQISTTKANL